MSLLVTTIRIRRRYAASIGRPAAVSTAGEALAIERLDQEAVHAGGEAGLTILGEGVGGQRDDRRARAPLAASTARMRRVASSPSRPGMCTSISTRS